jgi:hypothetical protein
MGSETYTDEVTDGFNPVRSAYVRAFLIDPVTGVDWTLIKGMDLTDSTGEYTFYLDPGSYIVTVEKNGVQIGSSEIEVVA